MSFDGPEGNVKKEVKNLEKEKQLAFDATLKGYLKNVRLYDFQEKNANKKLTWINNKYQKNSEFIARNTQNNIGAIDAKIGKTLLDAKVQYESQLNTVQQNIAVNEQSRQNLIDAGMSQTYVNAKKTLAKFGVTPSIGLQANNLFVNELNDKYTTNTGINLGISKEISNPTSKNPVSLEVNVGGGVSFMKKSNGGNMSGKNDWGTEDMEPINGTEGKCMGEGPQVFGGGAKSLNAGGDSLNDGTNDINISKNTSADLPNMQSYESLRVGVNKTFDKEKFKFTTGASVGGVMNDFNNVMANGGISVAAEHKKSGAGMEFAGGVKRDVYQNPGSSLWGSARFTESIRDWSFFVEYGMDTKGRTNASLGVTKKF
ncbi:MAG: hypothetical protein CO170_01930 [candidate division SR1 bacterium CG_4_9_14_3_um_filter_40_9]|nr:MAG: hypothetical protein CO170_01930 [candidate division SR1 bacterium CG_4_9_14_3_um_filter_40_9]